MKCPECDGYKNFVSLAGTPFEVVRPCKKCGGAGKIQQTNEEWFDMLSTTEEKAEAIYECVMANSWNFSKDGIKRWLKQPHTDKE